MNKYAIFFAATGPMVGRNYLADTNALLNSIEKHKLHEKVNGELDIYLIHYGFDSDWNYIKTACEKLSFNLIDHEIPLNKCLCDHKPIEYIKRIRYKILVEKAVQYNAVCLLDADMFFVSDEFVSMFEMVSGTNKLIGCNERIKWDAGSKQYFEKDGTPIFKEATKLYSMICNVPSIFDMKKWLNVFEYYNKISFEGYQITDKIKKGIGDLFAHNIAIHKMKRGKDVVMFPMETMAQVHHTWINPNTYIVKDKYGWRSAAGDKVYMIHDTKRICRKRFVDDNMNKYKNDFGGWGRAKSFEGKIRVGLENIQNEWFDLNFKGSLNLNDFIYLDDTFYKE